MKILVVLLVLAAVGFAFDMEYNTSGTIGTLPTYVGSSDGWGEYFIVPLQNTTSFILHVQELRFPCCGPTTSSYGWVVWDDLGDIVAPPAGDPTTADYYGAFTPVIASGSGAGDITQYTVVDITESNVFIEPGACWCLGYDNTQLGGQVTFNGVVTYGWYEGSWDSDQPWGRTALLEYAADYYMGALESTTWGDIKTLFD